VVSDKRRAHIARVTALLDEWALRMRLPTAEAQAWHDAGRWHDALRDASGDALRRWAGEESDLPEHVLHGPAAAGRLAAEGETRGALLDAIRWHTLGHVTWEPVGRALYLADFLEPGRGFAAAERASLAAQVPDAFEACFRRVVQWRVTWTIRDGKPLFPQTVDLWNAVR
jgi:2-amino-4-hydroxy-6-hydroxymethyldihydropteridine diphosphokinase